MINRYFIIFLTVVLSACGASKPPVKSEGHIKAPVVEEQIPEIVQVEPALPKPQKSKSLETYTVIVTEVPVRDLLFSMARDADLNIDIDNNIAGVVSMNAIDQTLPKNGKFLTLLRGK